MKWKALTVAAIGGFGCQAAPSASALLSGASASLKPSTLLVELNAPTSGARTSGAQQMLRLTSESDHAVIVPADELHLAGADASQFRLTVTPALPATLAPGASLAVQVRLSPNRAGLLQAFLTVRQPALCAAGAERRDRRAAIRSQRPLQTCRGRNPCGVRARDGAGGDVGLLSERRAGRAGERLHRARGGKPDPPSGGRRRLDVFARL